MATTAVQLEGQGERMDARIAVYDGSERQLFSTRVCLGGGGGGLSLYWTTSD